MGNNMRQKLLELKMDSFVEELSDSVDLNSKHESDLTKFIKLFPNPALIKQLINLTEDVRVDYKLCMEFRGIKKRMEKINKKVLELRPDLSKLGPLEQVVEQIIELSIVGETKEEIPKELEKIVKEGARMICSIRRDDADVHDSVEIAAKVYMVLDDFFNNKNNQIDKFYGYDFSNGFKKYDYDPLENIPYHGDINQDITEGNLPNLDKIAEEAKASGIKKSKKEIKRILRNLLKKEKVPMCVIEKKFEEITKKENNGQNKELSEVESYKIHRYKEWDYKVEEFSRITVGVIEEKVEPDVNAYTFESLYKQISAIKRKFEQIKPQAFEIRKRQEFGDEIDIDAAIEAIVNKQATGYSDFERVYIDRIKRKRDVSVALLLDVSGSTGNVVDYEEETVLDVEKKSLLLMMEALNILGDEFGVFAFDSDGGIITYYIIKQFSEEYNIQTRLKLSTLVSGEYTRLGGAIRHTTYKLLNESFAKTKLMIIISDGYPEDWGYGGEYAIEDVKKAVEEAKRLGVLTFAITVDLLFNQQRKKDLDTMYGAKGYLVLTDINELPHKLPDFYRGLTS